MLVNKIFKVTVLLIVILSVIIISSLSWIYISTKKDIYSVASEIPHNRVGLIPGCNKYISNGVLNHYYSQRINAGVKLFRQGKINYILVSGDNAHASYDEPREMRNSLVELGIPDEKIFSDYAGFRTLDTIVRAGKVFQLTDVTFISQNFHNQRGVFIGKHHNIDVVAYNAGNIDLKHGYKTEIREIFAKIKMLLDLYILDKEPKFLGDKILIGEPIKS